MQGPFSTRRGVMLYLAVWLMLGVLFAGLIVAASGAAWGSALLFALPATLVYAFAAGFSSYYLCRAYPLADKAVAAILLVLLVSAVMSSLLWTGFCVLWNGMFNALEEGIAIGPELKAMVFGLGLILYGLSAVANYLAIEFQRVRVFERRQLELQLLAQDAELRMLRTQIDPHFLFNSLNSISALTAIDPAGARDMTLRLADFFRHSLGLEAHRKVTLHDETTLVTHFLAIEKVRFGARLTVEQSIGADAMACLLPPMILQPLVENAVKHGIAHLTGGGAIRIAAQRAGSILRISVENDVDEDSGTASSTPQGGAASGPGLGLGLNNVRQRLAAAYGHQASVHSTRRDNLFRVELALPAETMAPDQGALTTREMTTLCA